CTQNGTLVAVSTFDDGVKVFRRASKELLHRFENIDQNSTAENISFSPDGTLLAIAYMDGPLDVVDTTDFHILYTIDAGGMIFSPDGRMGVIHAGENTIEFLDARRGTVLGSFQYPDDYCNLAFSPDGTKLMCGSTFGNIYLFEVVPTPGK
ncbi:MAG: hypothetical protein VB013_11390, partial [Anaerolineaceae bacterium]|nr:hypothetical protein [Anaerolineaceae bacterium]